MSYDPTWSEYMARHGVFGAPDGFIEWLRVATSDGTWTPGSFGTTDGVRALLAAWQDGADARDKQEATWLAK